MEEKTANDLQGQVRRRIGQVVLQALLLDVLLFLSAWTLRWVWGWAYAAVGLGILVLNAIVLSPEVIAERGNAHKANVKRWDRVLSAIMSPLAIALPILCGLDERFGWSPSLPWGVQVGGLAAIALGQGLFTWAMVSNKFFSTMVRIQAEREHAVETSGPYRYVRHPGYVGYIVAVWHCAGTGLAVGADSGCPGRGPLCAPHGAGGPDLARGAGWLCRVRDTNALPPAPWRVVSLE
jgi:hypothetical protein